MYMSHCSALPSYILFGSRVWLTPPRSCLFSWSRLVNRRYDNKFFELASNMYVCNRILHINATITFSTRTQAVVYQTMHLFSPLFGHLLSYQCYNTSYQILLSDDLAVTRFGVLFVDKTAIAIHQPYSKLSNFPTCLVLSCQVFRLTISILYMWNTTVMTFGHNDNLLFLNLIVLSATFHHCYI